MNGPEPSESGTRPGPLRGVRVLDLSIAAAGPWATAILGSQGADVIKVERPDGGDFMRSFGVITEGRSPLFTAWNRGKQSICINIKDPEGVALIHRLVATSDVLVHNLRSSDAEDCGLGYERLSDIRPQLIYARLSGWGEEGPRANDPAYDTVIQSTVGMTVLQADPQTGEPRFVNQAICDKTTGLTLAQLITAALFERERTGQGQRLHVSLLHSAMAFFASELGAEWAHVPIEGEPTKEGGSPLSRPKMPPVRRTFDGWVSFSYNREPEFKATCAALGLEQLLTDPRFKSVLARLTNRDALNEIVDPIVAGLSTDDLIAKLASKRVPHSVVNGATDVLVDPQIVASGLVDLSEYPDGERIRGITGVGEFSATPLGSPGLAPELGADTDAVLSAIGVDQAELQRLRSSGAIA